MFKILFLNQMYSQSEKFERFINSFSVVNNERIMDFGRIAYTRNSMSKQEAIDFVYNGDSTKLYCKGLIINLETEEIVGEITNLFLPDKSFKINTEQYFLIGYTSLECLSPLPNELRLNIMIVNKDYKIQDSMVVYKGNDYDWDIKSIFNPVTKKIFLVRNKDACLYNINPATMKFELIKEQNGITGSTDNLEMVLEQINWKEEFMN